MWQSLRLRQKVLVFFSILITLGFALGMMFLTMTVRVKQHNDHIYEIFLIRTQVFIPLTDKFQQIDIAIEKLLNDNAKVTTGQAKPAVLVDDATKFKLAVTQLSQAGSRRNFSYPPNREAAAKAFEIADELKRSVDVDKVQSLAARVTPKNPQSLSALRDAVESAHGILIPQEQKLSTTSNDITSLGQNLAIDAADEQTRAIWYLIAALSLYVPLGLGLALVASDRIVSIISQMQTAADELAHGKLSTRIAIKNNDEIGRLATAFNRMAERLEETKAQEEAERQQLAEELQGQQERELKLEKTQDAMLNLLEDARSLDAQLKDQKEHVEQTVKERTQQLREEQARLEASINSLNLGFIMTDAKQKIILMNGLSTSILAQMSHRDGKLDALTQKWTTSSAATAFGAKVNLIAKLKECAKTLQPIRLNNLEYGSRVFNVYIAPVTNSVHAIGAVILVHDVTEAVVLNRSKDEFFSIASHELRTPLTSMRGNSSMLMQYYPELIKDPTVHEIVDDIHTSSVRLIGIVNDFLDTSRIEQGRMEYSLEPFDLRQLAEEAVKEVSGVSTERKIPVKLLPLDQLPLVVADKNRTKQVIVNLIGNGLKFTEEGHVTIKLAPEKDMVRVTIADTGRGIPEDNQKLLFHKFTQAGDSLITRDSTKGTGLGLYISKAMVEGMGGSIVLDYSKPGKGTSFSFTLPIAKRGAKVAEPAPVKVE